MFKKTENFSKILVQHLFVVNLIKFIDCLVGLKLGVTVCYWIHLLDLYMILFVCLGV